MKTHRIGARIALGLGLALGAVAAASESYVPCKIDGRAGIEFPLRMMHEGVLHGQVFVLLEIDATGALSDALVTAYTRREFADAVLQGVKRWRFTAGSVDGSPIVSRLSLGVEFEATGVSIRHVVPDFKQLAVAEERFEHLPLEIADLDRVPKPVKQVAPIYPKQWIAEGRAGTVRIELFIDEEGRVRFPFPLGDNDPLLASAAAAAIREWRFEPPLRKKRPVLVRADVPFVFRPPELHAAGTP